MTSTAAATVKILLLCCFFGAYIITVGSCNPSVAVKSLGQRATKYLGGRSQPKLQVQVLPKTVKPDSYSNVDVDTNKTLRTVSDKFLSFAIDAFMIRNHWHYHGLNFSSPRMLTLAKPLVPGYLRVSGTAADFLIFDENTTSLPPADDDFKFGNDNNFTMTEQDWDTINEFAVNVGWQLIFGLNVLLRGDDGRWNPSNALKLMKYTTERGYRVDWELGNEPNLFPGKANITVPPEILAKDFATLRNILNNEADLRDSLLFGPDTTKPFGEVNVDSGLEFLEGFVSACDVTNATTFHQYYLCSRPPTPESFYDPDNLAILPKQIEAVKSVVEQHRPGSAIWLGETGTTCSDGSSALSMTYVAGFMFMDKLGIGASRGLDVVVRQTFIAGEQAMIDDDAIPLPDYWLSVLYKRLVGRRVLRTNVASKTGGKSNTGDRLRAYAHCTRTEGTNYKPGSVTLYIMSLSANETMTVSLTSIKGSTITDQFLLTAHEGDDVTTTRVDLNGKVLELVDDHTLPDMSPRRIKASEIQLPPLSMGFFVLTDVNAAACL